MLFCINNFAKGLQGLVDRPDLAAMITSGLFEECASGIASCPDVGADGNDDFNTLALTCALSLLRNCRQQPGAEGRIRSLAAQLGWCLENDMDVLRDMGVTTGAFAAQLCESPPAHCSGLHSCSTRVHLCRLWCLRARRGKLGVYLHATARERTDREVAWNCKGRFVEMVRLFEAHRLDDHGGGALRLR
eukprot:COSAG06_NODE_1936_length_8030_cov_4.318245_8_plen_189_part_00